MIYLKYTGVIIVNNVNKTLYIPLYGKALVSKKGIINIDKKAEKIWEKEQFPLKRKSKSKHLAYYMSMRSWVFDEWTKNKISEYPNAIVLHLGCGLDSRILRLDNSTVKWFDIDFESVINERKRYYTETEAYHMISGNIAENTFISSLPNAERAIVILEGVSMYLSNDELKTTLSKLKDKYSNLSILLDCYSPFAAKMSKIKNPINDVGVSDVYGIEASSVLENGTGLSFVKEHNLTPNNLIAQLKSFEKFIFKSLYAGKMSKKLYKLYEYQG